MPVPRRSPVKPRRRSPGSGFLEPSSGSRPARYRLFGLYRSDFLGNYGETAERVRAEGRGNCDVCRIAPAGDQHAADARDVVARIKSVPLAADIGFEPGCEIHRRVRDRHADIAQIARAVLCRDIHAAAKSDREVCEIPADAGTIAVSFPRRPAGARMLVAEGNMLVHVVADGLDTGPASRGF